MNAPVNGIAETSPSTGVPSQGDPDRSRLDSELSVLRSQKMEFLEQLEKAKLELVRVAL